MSTDASAGPRRVWSHGPGAGDPEAGTPNFRPSEPAGMGLGSTAKKLQGLADRAEQLYKQLKDVRARVIGMEESVEHHQQRLDEVETQVREQRALLEALAAEEDIDADAVTAGVEPAGSAGGTATAAEGDASGATGESDADAGGGGDAESHGRDRTPTGGDAE